MKYRFILPLVFFLLTIVHFSEAVTKTSTGNGNWNANATWSPSGQPAAGDDVVIQTGHSPNINVSNGQCRSLTIQSGGTCTIGSGKKITINHSTGIIVSGTLNINSGNITILNSSTNFSINAGGSVIWSPGDNTVAGATLFTNCTENFSTTSTLTIKKWYNTAIGLGTVVACNFGNLTINGVTGTWQMQNSLQTRTVIGTLSITNAYVVLDNTGAISNTNIGAIDLTNSSAFLDFFNGTHPGTFTVTSGQVNINGGELDGFYTAGTGTCNFIINGNLSLLAYGILMGSHNHNGHFNLTVNGNVTLNRSYFYGINSGSGNAAILITGNLTTVKNGSTYSEFYGIVDGNGNTSISINGNYTNQGYFDLIWNTGITGVGNGNGSLTIGGTFSQSDGDFRGIWNATTSNSGTCTLDIDTLNFTGGIFMATYSVASSSTQHAFTVHGPATIAFANSTDIFRGNGLATISGNQNNSSINIQCNGAVTISGNTVAEFSPNAGYGTETISFGSTVTISGGTINFGLTDHLLNMTSSGQFEISGGTIFLSKSSGNSTLTWAGNMLVNGGTLNIKNKAGKTNFTILGNLTINSGNVFLYSNASTGSTDSTNVYVNGDFTQTNGILNFSNNLANIGPSCLFINGGNFSLSGNGSITSFGAGTSNYFGKIIFNNITNTNYNRTSVNHHIQQVQYIVNSNGKLSIQNGPLEISSAATARTDFLSILNDGVLDLGNFSITSNGLSTYSGIQLLAGGTLKTKHSNGLYDGTANAALSASYNMDYDLNEGSTICYNGIDNQKISGYGNGIATAQKHKYGNLTIDFNGTPDAEYAYLERNTSARANVNFLNGELKLNGFTLTAESATATNGYAKSEENNAVNQSKLSLSYSPSVHDLTFYFGKSSGIPLPVTLNITNNPGSGYITLSTRATSNNNSPLPGNDNVAAISNINPGGADVSVSNVIDRWWEISAPGVTADIALRYAGVENTTQASVSGGNFNIQAWNGVNFTKFNGTGTGVSTGIGIISGTINNVNGPVTLSSGSASLPIKLLDFQVRLLGDEAEIKWSTAEEKNNDYFTIERSPDNINFEKIQEIDGAGNSTSIKQYTSIDYHPLPGTSYYRLKQTDYDGHFTYSPVRSIHLNNTSSLTNSVSAEILSLSPNPFSNEFAVKYNISQEGESKVTIYNMSGQVVFESLKYDKRGLNTFNFIDENSLPPANYILQIISGTDKISKKIIKTSL